MIDKNELCNKIRDIYPDIGECGIDVDVAFDETNVRIGANRGRGRIGVGPR